MKALCFVAVCCLVVLPAAAAPKPVPKATNKDKIVGLWAMTKGEKNLPPGMTMEYTRGGEVKVSAAVGGGLVRTVTGKYEVKGDKLHYSYKGRDGKETKRIATILKLTATELHLKNYNGVVEEFKRKRTK